MDRIPVLCASLPFVNIRATHIGEGMGDFLPRVRHDRMCGIHELVKTKFVEEMVGFLSVPVKNRRFLSLEWFSIYSSRIQVSWKLWWRSRWRCWRRRSSERLL